jgi:hypothetical protein
MPPSSILKFDAAGISEMLVNVYQTTRRLDIPEHRILHNYFRQNLKTRTKQRSSEWRPAVLISLFGRSTKYHSPKCVTPEPCVATDKLEDWRRNGVFTRISDFTETLNHYNYNTNIMLDTVLCLRSIWYSRRFGRCLYSRLKVTG